MGAPYHCRVVWEVIVLFLLPLLIYHFPSGCWSRVLRFFFCPVDSGICDAKEKVRFGNI